MSVSDQDTGGDIPTDGSNVYQFEQFEEVQKGFTESQILAEYIDGTYKSMDFPALQYAVYSIAKESTDTDVLTVNIDELRNVDIPPLQQSDDNTISADDAQSMSDSIFESHSTSILRMIGQAAYQLGYEGISVVGSEDDADTTLESLRTDDVGEIITTEVRVTERTDPFSFVRNPHFRCPDCGFDTSRTVELDSSEIEIPKCSGCDSRANLQRFSTPHESIDKQDVIIQDLHTRASTSTPTDMRAIATHTDVNELEPGETVRLTGLVKDESGDQAAKEYYIQITGIEHLDKSYAGVEITDDEEEEIKELAASDHVHSHLKSSIAPTIKGDYDLAREALLLQLVGGVGRGDDQRSQIHVALVGDPGTGKTSLSRYTDKIAPNSEYQSADNVTKVGLTAAVTREERFDTAQWTLSGGVLVRADGGHAIIDELDKAPESVQSSLQEPLQDQVIDVSKASISATLPARCSVLLVANPDNERYDRYQEISKQIPITPTIWSRMDAIIPFVDEPDEEVDGAVVESILNQATGEEPDVVSPEMMRKYVSYARQIDPVLSEEAERYIDEQWSEIRQQSASGSTTIGYRQAKSLVRFAEASARIRLSETATLEDAERAVSLLRGWMDLIASDEDGSYNIDAVESGADLSQRQRIEAMWRTIDGQADDDGWAVRDEVVSELVEMGIDKTDAQQTINKFLGKGSIEQDDDGRLKDLRNH